MAWTNNFRVTPWEYKVVAISFKVVAELENGVLKWDSMAVRYGRGARSIAEIADGRVAGIKITRAGSGYKKAPHIFVSPPRKAGGN